jgi:hypothetical protein
MKQEVPDAGMDAPDPGSQEGSVLPEKELDQEGNVLPPVP